MKAKGFTLIEMMIVLVFIGIIGILATIVGLTFFGNGPTQGTKMSFGLNGLTETRCIRGYEFVVGANGSTQQVLNAQGGGVQC